MGNCLVKKLQNVVEDENLLGLGEILITIPASTTEISWSFYYSWPGPSNSFVFGDTVVKLKSGAPITEKFGNKTIWYPGDTIKPSTLYATKPSGEKSVLSITNKYGIVATGDYEPNYAKLNFNDLKYLSKLQSCHITDMENITKDEFFEFANARPNLHNVNYNWNVESLNEDKWRVINGHHISGDASQLGQNVFWCKAYAKIIPTGILNETHLSWSATTRTGKLLALYLVNLGDDLDRYFNAIKDCEVDSLVNTHYLWNRIIAFGNRTHASDDAIAAIQAKGITIQTSSVKN